MHWSYIEHTIGTSQVQSNSMLPPTHSTHSGFQGAQGACGLSEPNRSTRDRRVQRRACASDANAYPRLCAKWGWERARASEWVRNGP